MKYLFTIAVIVLIIDCIVLVSCKKESTTAALTGTWQVVTDSTSIAGSGPFKGGGQTYTGTPADHYIFTTDGHLYVREGSNIDTATYVVNDTKLNLTYTYLLEGGALIRGAVNAFDISNFIGSTLTLSQNGITPEGRMVQIIKLKRE